MKTLHDGRLALVTGATRGLGRAIAERLRDDGAKVIGTGTQPSGKVPEGCEYMAVDFTGGGGSGDRAPAADDGVRDAGQRQVD